MDKVTLKKSLVSHLTCTLHTTTQSGPASQRSAAGAADNSRTSMLEILSQWMHPLARAINRLIIMVILTLPTQKPSAICKAKLNCICICIGTARHVPGGRRVRLLAHKSSCQHRRGRTCWWRRNFLITASWVSWGGHGHGFGLLLTLLILQLFFLTLYLRSEAGSLSLAPLLSLKLQHPAWVNARQKHWDRRSFPWPEGMKVNHPHDKDVHGVASLTPHVSAGAVVASMMEGTESWIGQQRNELWIECNQMNVEHANYWKLHFHNWLTGWSTDRTITNGSGIDIWYLI